MATQTNSTKKTGPQSGRSSENTSEKKRQQGSQQKGARNEGLNKLFEHQLEDLYYVETQLVKEIPKMAEKAKSKQLIAALKDHLKETKGQVERLDAIFKIIGKPAKGKKCEAIDGILKEAKELMEEFSGDRALDAAITAAAQKVEHYEITSYGSLCAFAEQLGMDEVCDEIEAILDEEKAADKKLSQLAEDVLNIKADASEGSTEDDEDEEDGTEQDNADRSKKRMATTS